MAATVHAICPQLPVADMAASVSWYVRELGFLVLRQDNDFALLTRDGCELHLWRCDDPSIATMSSAYIRSADVDDLFEAMRGAAEQGRISAPENRDWGMREFYVWDPDGNLLKFGQSIEDETS